MVFSLPHSLTQLNGFCFHTTILSLSITPSNFLFLFAQSDFFATTTSFNYSASSIWGVFFFTFSAYLLLVYSAVLYFLSMLTETTVSRSTAQTSKTFFLDGLSAYSFVNSLPLVVLLLLLSWSGPAIVSGFGHLEFTSFERKTSLLVLTMFVIYLLILLPSFFFTNSSSYDLIITLTHLTYWLMFLFYTSNVLSLSFVIEVLTGLITLLLITSYTPSYHSGVDSDSYTNKGFLNSLPSTYFSSLLIFFWTSLVTTLMLFLFLIVIYSKFLTFEWSLVDHLANFFSCSATSFELSTLSLTWSLMLIAIFLKCAITPFYLWKPTFFKGLSYISLFYYIFVFYFIVFLYFVNFILGLFSDVFFFNVLFLTLIVTISTFLLPSLMYESLNIKSFFAISSIMNSVIVLFTTLSFNTTSVIVFL